MLGGARRSAVRCMADRCALHTSPPGQGQHAAGRPDDGEENRGVRAEPGGVPASLFLRERRPRAPFRMSECLSMKFEGTKHVRTVSLDIKT